MTRPAWSAAFNDERLAGVRALPLPDARTRGPAEGPLAGGAGLLPRSAGLAQVALTLAPGHLLGDVAEQGVAELAHRLGGEHQLAVGAAAERAAVAQRALQLLQGPGVDRRAVAELPGELVEVDVVEPRPGV